MFDQDGYPTEETLRLVRTFTGSAHELVTLLYESTKAYGVVTIEPFDDDFNRAMVKVYMATGGWSGNESIVGALMRSFFWFAYWESSMRGGAYTFHVPADRWDNPMPEWPPATAVDEGFTAADVVRAIEAELDDADQVTDTLEKPNYITVWGVRRTLAPFGGKPHRFPVPAERCAECRHLSWNHYQTEQSTDGCAECSCLLSRREAEWGRDEEMDETIRQALFEDALTEGYDPDPDDR